MSAAAQASAEHPSPHRHKVDVRRQLAALAAGPTAWILQLTIGYGLSSHFCFPREAPHLAGLPARWASEPAWLLTVNLACLVVAIAGAVTSWRHWRDTRKEKPGDACAALDVGEGRSRFLAACGALAGAGFALAILFDTLEPLMVAACWKMVA